MQWRVVSYRVLSRVVECSRVMSALHMSALHHHHMSALHNMSALHIALETHIALWCKCASRQLHQACASGFTHIHVYFSKIKVTISALLKVCYWKCVTISVLLEHVYALSVTGSTHYALLEVRVTRYWKCATGSALL